MNVAYSVLKRKQLNWKIHERKILLMSGLLHLKSRSKYAAVYIHVSSYNLLTPSFLRV